jgi:Rrf2 family protein
MGLMQIPRRVDYGLRAVIYLSDQLPGKCCSIAEIAKHQGVPKKFLEKIIQILVRRGLIQSKRGSAGGYRLARPAESISFCDVIEAIEGPISVNACLDHALGCDQIPRCTMIGVWSEVQRSVTEVLSRTTIAALRQPACKEFVAASSLSSAA